MKGPLWQTWEEIDPITERHCDGRNLDPASRKRRVILERRETASVFQGDRSNGSAPKSNLSQRHRSSPHCHFFDEDFAFGLADARCRFRPRNFNCSTGLNVATRPFRRLQEPEPRAFALNGDSHP
jgi:hypothetical protein